MIEAPDARSRHVDEHPINCACAFVVKIEALQQEMAQKTSALRDAKCVHAFGRGREILAFVLQLRREIAHRRETEPREQTQPGNRRPPVPRVGA